MTNFNRTTEIPAQGELWLTYHEFKNDSRIAVMECLGRLEDSPDHLPPAEEIGRKMTGTPIKGRYLWDPDHDVIGEVGHAISNVKWLFRLPEDPEDFDDEYRSLLDYVRGYLTKEEIAELLTGAEVFHSRGETGYEALRRWSLTGSFDSVTEYSVGHGHGPSRHGRSVENQLDEMPQHLIEDYLATEKERWTGGFWDEETASYVVEVLLLKDEYTDEDVEDEITEIVNKFNLGYDEYIRGHFTAHDCPSCRSELIERPEQERGYITIDCSDCEKQYKGVYDGNQLTLHHEVDGGDDDE